MRVVVTAVREGAGPQDVVVGLDDGARVTDVATALKVASGPDRTLGAAQLTSPVVVPFRAPGLSQTGPAAHTAPTLWVDGEPCSPDAAAEDVLRDGSRVSVDDAVGPFTQAQEPTGLYELRIAGGPAAGRVTRLLVGAATIGSDPTCTLVVNDSQLPPFAARVTIDVKQRVTLTPQPGVSVHVEDEESQGEQPWKPGTLAKIGDSLFVLEAPEDPDAHLSPNGDGGLAYNRPPRLSPLPQRRRLVVPVEPKRGESPRLQLIAALLPLPFGLIMYWMTNQPYVLLFCLMSPLMMVAHWASDARHERKKHRQAVKKYRADLARYEKDLIDCCRADQEERRAGFPDPAAVLLFASGPRRRLWERRITDPDAMLLRIGMAGLPADLELAIAGGGSGHEDAPQPPIVADVPVTLPFCKLGVVGIAGDRTRTLASARWLTSQAAVLHSPRDLSIVVLSSSPDAAAEWTWVHWLPHTTPQLGQDCLALVGSDAETAARRVNELLTELTRRKAAGDSPGAARAFLPDPHVLLVLDGARRLRRMPGVPQLLQEGPKFGIFALCLDEDERLLPEECGAAVCWAPGAPHHVHVRGGGLESAGEVLADQVTADWCELTARSLAPVRDVSRDEADSALPASARLLSLLQMPDPRGSDLATEWRLHGGATTAAAIGLAADGPYVLDISRDGPHALVAGTTGAGKSELLQTLIASLAVGNRPDALNFVLIDYKGGSAFQDCARLPHTVGMVSDLDAHLTERALASLAAELKRRETSLFSAGTKDLEDYNDARALRSELEPIPRLVIVIDEFASLVAELPHFIAGLVDIARRGRSLGVHLVLATQRPAGVVSADISANTNLRIALRVTDASESTDVIGAPDAAAIAKSTPGRAYVRSGAQSLVPVQSARIGGRRPTVASGKPKAALLPLTWSACGRSPFRTGAEDDEGTRVTDLQALVDAVRAGSEEMGFGRQRQPWMEPLPSTVTLDGLEGHGATDDLGRADGRSGTGGAGTDPPASPVAFGVTDRPAEQRRAELCLDLLGGENTMLIGGPRSGRSTALRTLAGAVARARAPHDVHLYALDCGSNTLLPLMGLPHCGAVVTRDDPGRVRRLLDRLLAEVSRRQQLLATQGVSSAAEQRSGATADERLPWMVLLLDGWESFASEFEDYDYGRLIDSATRIFREGPAVGLRVVATTDRSGFTGTVGASFGDKLVLRLASPEDYSMAGLQARDVPKDMPPGRALRLTDAGVEESQVALLAPDPSGQAQVAALRTIAQGCPQIGAGAPKLLRPLRVDALPSRVTLQEATALVPGPERSIQPLWTPVAVGGDELAPLGVDLQESGPGFVIAGPPKSGRSSTLVAAAQWLLSRDVPLILVTPKRSPLRQLVEAKGVVGSMGAGSSADDVDALLERIHSPYVVVIDDAELLHETELDDRFETLVKRGVDGDHALVAAGATDQLSSQYRGFVTEARRSRNGLLLCPQGPDDGDLFGIRLPRNVGSGPAGSGLLVRDGAPAPVQALLPDAG